MTIVEKICEKLASKLDKRVIHRSDGKPYLERYYILRSTKYKYIPGIYLHKFLSSDEDPELHNHPWGSSMSIILTGGYKEERRYEEVHNNEVNRYVVTEYVTPGSLNFIKKNDFHRIDLLKEYAWTIFFSGNREQDWGFWNKDTDKYIPWKKHIENRKQLK